MSMKTFLFAADALRIEEGVDWTLIPAAGERAAPRADVGAKNAQAMSMLGPALALAGKKGKR